MFPEIVVEESNLGLYILGNLAWYNPETNQIHIVKGLEPRWLGILHEYGHWLIGYAPDWLHKRVSLDYEYDRVWEWLGLSGFISIIIPNKGEAKDDA